MKFADNNNFKATIDMSLYKALYEKWCRTPFCWDEVGERELVGPQLVQVTNEVVKRSGGECVLLKVDRKVMWM